MCKALFWERQYCEYDLEFSEITFDVLNQSNLLVSSSGAFDNLSRGAISVARLSKKFRLSTKAKKVDLETIFRVKIKAKTGRCVEDRRNMRSVNVFASIIIAPLYVWVYLARKQKRTPPQKELATHSPDCLCTKQVNIPGVRWRLCGIFFYRHTLVGHGEIYGSSVTSVTKVVLTQKR